MKPRSFLPRRSKKKLAHDAQSGRRVFSTITKKTRITPKKRSAKAAERIYGPQDFRDWLHTQSCIVCGMFGYTEQAHAKTGGTGRKDDWQRTLPLCGPHPDYARTVVNGPNKPAFVPIVEGCHRESGRGVKTFEAKHHVTLLDLAAETQSRWRQVSASLLSEDPTHAE